MKEHKTDLDLSFAKETIGFYIQRAIIVVDSLWVDKKSSALHGVAHFLKSEA